MKNLIVVTLLASLTLLVYACGGFDCPSPSNNITWNSYGRFSFGKMGPDATARSCISSCGWSVFEGNDGGEGNTLQIAAPGDAVVFVWAYNNFAGFRVKEGWTGQTDQGVKLGDSQTTFLAHYPKFTANDPNQLTYSDTSTEVTAYFDQKGLLTELNVGVPYISAP